MNIKFAFAVNNNGLFQKKHYGDAEKYFIYQLKENEINFEQEIVNSSKNVDENGKHGSKKKGQAIIALLKEKNVNVLVSPQFGKNIKLINAHFIPVIVSEENPDSIIGILLKHIKHINEELANKSGEYMLFNIKNGVMKPAIKKLNK
ncbi:MAG: hypothetical protein K8R67_02710 [Desulfobacteraceae bacterium]|nr:hypothetical protein [Desulfobacteraceae bacterium]